MTRNVELFRIGGRMEFLGRPPDATIGVAYSYTFTAIGGVAPYLFLYAGLPSNGLSLSTSGVLSGASPTAGTFSFTVYLYDSGRNSPVLQTFTITVS